MYKSTLISKNLLTRDISSQCGSGNFIWKSLFWKYRTTFGLNINVKTFRTNSLVPGIIVLICCLSILSCLPIQFVGSVNRRNEFTTFIYENNK